MTALTELHSLISLIFNHFSDDHDKLRTLKIILLKFKRSPNNPVGTLNDIKTLLSDNSDICNKIDDVIKLFSHNEEGEEEFDKDKISLYLSNFIKETNALTDNKNLGFVLSEVISYYSEELITLNFLHYYVSLLTSDLPEDVQHDLHSKIHYLAHEINLYKIKILQFHQVANPLIDSIPKDFDIEPNFSNPPQLQFLVMINLLVLNAENLSSIMKCLKMYGNNVISDMEAVQWIQYFDQFLGDFFMKIILNTEPASFLPENLKKLVDNSIPSESQRFWAIGEYFYEIIRASSEIDEENNNNIQTSEQLNSEIDFEESYQGENQKTFLPQSVLKMRASIFYKAIISSISSLKKIEKVNFPENIIKSLYGNYKVITDSPHSIGIVINRCNQIGEESVDNIVKLISKAMSEIDPLSNDWRIYYSTLLKPNFVTQMLVFQGFVVELNTNQNIISQTNQILKDFCRKFSKIHPEFLSFFSKCFEEGVHYCYIDTALCLYYYFSIVHSIFCSQNANSELILSIPDLVFSNPSPLNVFGSTPLSQIDIPLANFAKTAAKIVKRWRRQGKDSTVENNHISNNESTIIKTENPNSGNTTNLPNFDNAIHTENVNNENPAKSPNIENEKEINTKSSNDDLDSSSCDYSFNESTNFVCTDDISIILFNSKEHHFFEISVEDGAMEIMPSLNPGFYQEITIKSEK